ncbi:hypothetical protein YC2023_094831 [Brassica napus]
MSEAPAGASNDEKCLTCNLPLDLPRPALVVETPSVYHTRGLGALLREYPDATDSEERGKKTPKRPVKISPCKFAHQYRRLTQLNHFVSLAKLSQSTGKLRCHCGVHDSIATLVVVLFSRVPRGRWLSKEMRSVIALHHRELRTTEAHRHVISHTPFPTEPPSSTVSHVVR